MARVADIKESAVREKRIWVRLNRLCNNRCLFCLDSDSHDGHMESREQVEQLIRKGREEGGQRLILSGGEATLHPDYLDFVKLGRSLGYGWIQTISNGRMFAYRRFADAAVAAGLSEVTFSMHGHHAELHDRLVGVQGAFAQALSGMQNLVNRIVVNVDVVLNRQNIPVLNELLEFYMGLGIHEFDLLHMVPFGRAWSSHREELFYDPVEMAPYLRKAFAHRRKKGVYLWTNRLPAAFLEGAEDLIQDPHKQHDEVRGRMDMYRDWSRNGTPPICQGERCPFCSMEGYCARLEATLSSLKNGTIDSVLLVPEAAALFARLLDEGSLSSNVAVHLLVRKGEDPGWLADRWPHLLPKAVLVFDPGVVPDEGHRIVARWRFKAVDEAGLAAAEELLNRRPDARVSLPLSKSLLKPLKALKEAWGQRVGVHAEPRDFLSDSESLDPDLDELNLMASLVLEGVEGLPLCLGGQPLGEPRPAALDLRTLDADGNVDPGLFTDEYIANGYHVFSLRCASCRKKSLCKGLHINLARNLGLKALKPIRRS